MFVSIELPKPLPQPLPEGKELVCVWLHIVAMCWSAADIAQEDALLDRRNEAHQTPLIEPMLRQLMAHAKEERRQAEAEAGDKQSALSGVESEVRLLTAAMRDSDAKASIRIAIVCVLSVCVLRWRSTAAS